MPGFDDSFLYDCAKFEQTNRLRAQRRVRPSNADGSSEAVILKSANQVDPDPLVADGARERPPGTQSPDGGGGDAPEDGKRRTLLGFLGSPGFARRSGARAAAPRSKLFGGSNCTYDVVLSQQQHELQNAGPSPARPPGAERSLYRRTTDEYGDLLPEPAQPSYEGSGIHQSANVSAVTSTPVSSGRTSSAGGSNGAAGSNSASAGATGSGTPVASGNNEAGCSGATVTTPGAPGSSGHKGSIRGNKLARRARSFKDDFLEKISQIRTPTSTMTRSHSPNSPRGSGGCGAGSAAGGSAANSYGAGRKSTTDEPTKPVQDLNYHVRQVKNALTHFKDVILKNKLEMLPGNGTVVLESIANVHTALQSYTLNEHSTAFINATNHVHVSLGNLLKLCDEVLLTKAGEDCPSLSKENVKEVVGLVENAINNLVNLANEKISDKPLAGAGSGSGGAAGGASGGGTSNTLQRPTVDVISQRTSLPDIPLTPRERDILEQTSLKTVRTSHSTESILRDSSPPPPPKPPLPDRSSEPPPPLPPKRKGHHAKNHSFHDTTTASAAMMAMASSDCCHSSDSAFHLHQSGTGGGAGGSGSIGLDRMSLRSRSPEDNSSLLSASAGSLDSALNHSREEEELRALSDASMATGIGMLVSAGGGNGAAWELDSSATSATPTAAAMVGQGGASCHNRSSNESGFESIYSLRVSQRDHQQQHHHHQHHHHQISASSQSSSSSSSFVHKSESFIDSLNAALSVATSKATLTQHQQQQQLFHQKIDTIITQASDECASTVANTVASHASATVSSMSSTSSGSLAKQLLVLHGPSGSIDEPLSGSDDVFPRTPGLSERPPALPVKTRTQSIKKERHPSQYDNVDEVDTDRSTQDVFAHFPKHSSPTYLTQQMFNNLPSKHISLFEPRHMMNRFQEEPPPLPMKKKHIMAYMEIFGSATQNQTEFMRHSVHTYNMEHTEQVAATSTTTNHSISHSQTMSLSPSRMAPVSVSPPGSPNVIVKPPALPPKRQRINSKTPSIVSTPPASPKIFQDQQHLHHQNHHQFPPQAASAINTSPSPSTASLASSHSGGGNACRSVSSVYNQAAKVLHGGGEVEISQLESTVSALSLHGPNAAGATVLSTGPAGGAVAPTSLSKHLGTTGAQAERSKSTSPHRESACSSNNKLAPGGSTGGGAAKKAHQSEEDYLLLQDYSSSSPLTANVPPPANLSCASSQTNLKNPTNSLNSGDGGGSGNSLVISSINSGSEGTNTSPSHLNNGSSGHNVEPSICLNDSFHSKVSGRQGSSSASKLELVTPGETIYESCATAVSDPSGEDNDERNSGKEEVEVEVVLRRNNKNGMTLIDHQQPQALNLMEELDVSSHLVFKKENEDGPDVKGGHPDALIIHATRVQKNSDAYGEAFITTFRTFISPLELIQKLSHRYTVYHCQMNDAKQKAAKESFSLLVRVVNDLTTPDLSERLLVILMNFDYQLVSAGHLNMAKVLRVKLIEKALVYKQKAALVVQSTERSLMSNPPTLLDLKSAEIAEQMTLLDAELFQKIEIPEVLIWAQEQCEERSPNLTRFTEHFNKMSYWARTQILSQTDAKDREKHVIKFIKIMKHLRKINNYNSYLALLSALDSAPIRRLEWHKTITEGLKEYCALIDSSSSFRAYRQALAETNPPCIPYIGLVLQDLTFVHIGNPDLLPDGSTNFSKRWQQYHIVVNMKRFRKGSYPFKKNERIIGFFDNFDRYLDEDAMWQISETIKPRGSRKPNVN